MSVGEISIAYRPPVVGAGAVTAGGRQAADLHSANTNHHNHAIHDLPKNLTPNYITIITNKQHTSDLPNLLLPLVMFSCNDLTLVHQYNSFKTRRQNVNRCCFQFANIKIRRGNSKSDATFWRTP
jgi:hypothetical protein